MLILLRSGFVLFFTFTWSVPLLSSGSNNHITTTTSTTTSSTTTASNGCWSDDPPLACKWRPLMPESHESRHTLNLFDECVLFAKDKLSRMDCFPADSVSKNLTSDILDCFIPPQQPTEQQNQQPQQQQPQQPANITTNSLPRPKGHAYHFYKDAWAEITTSWPCRTFARAAACSLNDMADSTMAKMVHVQTADATLEQHENNESYVELLARLIEKRRVIVNGDSVFVQLFEQFNTRAQSQHMRRTGTVLSPTWLKLKPSRLTDTKYTTYRSSSHDTALGLHTNCTTTSNGSVPVLCAYNAHLDDGYLVSIQKNNSFWRNWTKSLYSHMMWPPKIKKKDNGNGSGGGGSSGDRTGAIYILSGLGLHFKYEHTERYRLYIQHVLSMCQHVLGHLYAAMSDDITYKQFNNDNDGEATTADHWHTEALFQPPPVEAGRKNINTVNSSGVTTKHQFRVLVMEVTTQHHGGIIDSKEKVVVDGLYRGINIGSKCTALTTKKRVWYNEILREELATGRYPDLDFVPLGDMTWHLHDLHPSDLDCTHYCYSPSLVEAFAGLWYQALKTDPSLPRDHRALAM